MARYTRARRAVRRTSYSRSSRGSARSASRGRTSRANYRRTGRSAQTVRIVVQSAPAPAVNPLMQVASPAPKKAKF